MTNYLSDERCPACAKKLTDYDHLWAECAECGYRFRLIDDVDDVDDDDDVIDWMEGYED